jgi:two-component system, cell cycle response regulator
MPPLAEALAPVSAQPQVFMMIADPVLEGLYRGRLQNQNYCAVWCEKGTSWEPALAAFNYDIVVLDFTAFPTAPLEALRQVRRVSPDSEILVLSNNEDATLAIGAFRIGIADYFLKPVEPETLAWAIEKALRQRAFRSSNATLDADFKIFRTAHHMGVSESDAKTRELGMKCLVEMTHASGAFWIWPESQESEAYPKKLAENPGLFERMTAELGINLKSSFETHLTSHPEQWFRGRFLWAPLKNSWMGGIFLFDVQATPDMQARVEFLIRNLEISLENSRRYAEAKQLTYTDDFTGLYNARYLDVALNASIEEATATSQSFAVLFIDVDKFKSVNDSHGHMVGSGLLIALAKALKRNLRKPDQLFRYGGDEFILLLPSIELKDAMMIGERIRSNIERSLFKIHNVDIKITVSIGVSAFPHHSRNKRTILELADKAMYSGKRQGRNAVFEAGT